MFGKCINSGQICIAPNYVMCTKEVEAKLVETIKKLMEDWYKNDPQASDCEFSHEHLITNYDNFSLLGQNGLSKTLRSFGRYVEGDKRHCFHWRQDN